MSAPDICACGSRFHRECTARPAAVDDRSETERASAAKALAAALAGEAAALARARDAEAQLEIYLESYRLRGTR